MDSTLASEFAASQVEVAAARRGRWWRALLRRSGTVDMPAEPRVRRLELNGRRCWSLGLAAAGLAALASLADTWQMHRAAVDDAADAAVRFIDHRLDDVDLELKALEVELDRGVPGTLCDAATVAALVRASLASTLVDRFVVAQDGGAPACHPDGAASPLPALAVTPRLALHSTGEIATRLLATRSQGADRVLAAVLDARAFEPEPAAESPWRNSVPVRVTLMSPDARPLRRLDRPPQRARFEASSWGALWSRSGFAGLLNPLGGRMAYVLGSGALARQHGSLRHAVMVRAEVDPASFVAAAVPRLLWVLLASSLVFVLGLAAHWSWAARRSRLVIRLEHALAKRQFEPVIQPIVDLATGQCAGGEVLMRWAHPERGTLGPGEFIEEAERTGLVVPMSELVMSRAAHRLAPLAAAQPSLYFSINVAPAQLRQLDFARRLATWFNADTVPREQVLLELTEREAVDPGAAQALAALHAQGWRTAIDDFGTGHSSLAALERMPIDRIKIDRAFVSTIGEQTASRPVLDAIIALAGELNVRLIAEGVETRAQWDYLAARGVRYAQGYLIARPMSIDAFGSWLAAQQTVEPASATAATAPMPPRPDGPARSAGVDALAHQLWERMRSTGGLDVRDRIHRLRNYSQCFVGREAVDWLVRHQRIGRDDAVRLGQRLAALGLIRHVVDEHDFKDAELFYRLQAGDGDAAQGATHATDLRQSIRGHDGPQQGNRASGLLMHRRCTTGREIVDWIVGRYGITRPTAVQWGAQLMRTSVLRHVFDDRPFRDDGSFYRIS